MTSTLPDGPRLLAISDLHVAYPENRAIVADLTPEHEDDWLIVAGDVGELSADIEWALRTLSERFHTVIWAPGNHELWTHPNDPLTLRGEERYRHLVAFCRALGIRTPEDPYVTWTGAGGPVTVAPLFLLYDYTFRTPGAATKDEALALAHAAGIVCTDEYMLHPDPYPTRDAWCAQRIAYTRNRLDERDPALPTVLINHFPMRREPTDVLRFPEFAIWCGTTETADWHLKYDAAVSVYGHLHIPRTTWYDGIRFEEVSIGYPRERKTYRMPPPRPRVILPAPGDRS